jgi:hypothetical protein
LPLLIHSYLKNIAVLDGHGRRATITTLGVEGICRIFEDLLPNAIFPGYYILILAKFGRCVPSDIKSMETSVFPILRLVSTSISTLLSFTISL